MSLPRTSLALSTAGNTVRRPGRSPIVSATSNNLKLIAQNWRVMTTLQKNPWLSLAAQMAHDSTTGTPRRTSAYGAFVSVNTTLLLLGGSVTQTPPTDYTHPNPLPGIVVDAGDSGPLNLHLRPQTTYGDNVLIYGAKPVLAAQNIYIKTSFTYLGSLSGLSLNNNISALYLSKFRAPDVGSKLGLKLIGATNDGFRSSPIEVFGIYATSGQTSLTLK